MLKIGDLVKRKSYSESSYPSYGIITKVYESRIKTTVEVIWFADNKFNATYCTIEPYYLEKVS